MFLEKEPGRLRNGLSGGRNVTQDESVAGMVAVAELLRRLASEPVPEASNTNDARARLLAAVAHQRALRMRTGHRKGVRGTTLAAAAIAGAGMLVASAATSGNPVSFVRDSLGQLPAIVARQGSTPRPTAVPPDLLFTTAEGRPQTSEEPPGAAASVSDVEPTGWPDVPGPGTPPARMGEAVPGIAETREEVPAAVPVAGVIDAVATPVAGAVQQVTGAVDHLADGQPAPVATIVSTADNAPVSAISTVGSLAPVAGDATADTDSGSGAVKTPAPEGRATLTPTPTPTPGTSDVLTTTDVLPANEGSATATATPTPKPGSEEEGDKEVADDGGGDTTPDGSVAGTGGPTTR